jgi:hypothetical protein
LGVKGESNESLFERKQWACAATIHTVEKWGSIIPMARAYEDPVTGTIYKAGFPSKKHIFNFPESRALTEAQETYMKKNLPIKSVNHLAEIICRKDGGHGDL